MSFSFIQLIFTDMNITINQLKRLIKEEVNNKIKNQILNYHGFEESDVKDGILSFDGHQFVWDELNGNWFKISDETLGDTLMYKKNSF